MPAGYDIGASASTANSTPQNQSAPTIFNFNSAGASYEGGYQSAYGPATAVATSKSPGAQTDVGGSSGGGGSSGVDDGYVDPNYVYANPNSVNPNTNPALGVSFGISGGSSTLLIGALLAATALLIYLHR